LEILIVGNIGVDLKETGKETVDSIHLAQVRK